MIPTIYLLVLIAVAWLVRRSARDAVGFFLAGRTLGAWPLGLSLAATAFGGSAILIASRLIYLNGLPAIWFSLSVALGFGVLGWGVAHRIRASGAHSLAHFVGLGGGPALRRWISLWVVVVEVAFFGLTVKGCAVLCVPLMGEASWAMAHPRVFEAAIATAFVAYTLIGGQRADVLTDLIQVALIALILVGVLLPVALVRTDWAALPAGWRAFPFNEHIGPVWVLNMLVLMGLPGIVGGDVFAKMLSARDPRAARRGAWIASAALGALTLTVAVLALAARARWPELDQPRLAVVHLARAALPAGFGVALGLLLLSALLSTGDSVLLTASTHLTWDVLGRGEDVSMRVARGATLVVAAAGLVLALWFGGLLQIMKFAYTLLTSAVVVPTLYLMLAARQGGGEAAVPQPTPRRRDASATVAWAASLTGLVAAAAWAAWAAHLDGWSSRLGPATVGVTASLLAAALAWALCGARRNHGNFLRTDRL